MTGSEHGVAPTGEERTQPERVPEGAAGVPPWLVNLAAVSWRLAAITLVLAATGFLAASIKTVTAGIAVAVVFTAVLVPAARSLRRRGRSANAAAAIVWAGGLLACVVLLVVLAVAFVPHVASIVQQLQAGFGDLQARLEGLQAPPIAAVIVGRVVEIGLSLLGAVASTVADAAASVGTSLILATFLVFFLLRDGDRAWGWFLQSTAPEKRIRLTESGEQALERVAGYLIGTTVLSAIIAVTDFVFLAALGVPLAAPLALLVFLAGYIPYFGGIITTIVLLLVTLATAGSVPTLVLVVLMGVRSAVVGYVVRPSLYGRNVKLHPALVLIALPAGYEVAGVVGLFAAVPLLAVVITVARAVVETVQPEDPPALPGLVPPWLDRMAQWSWRLLAALVLVALLVLILIEIPMVVVPVLLGTILAATFAPAVAWLQRRGWGRTRAVALTLGGSFLAITVMLVLAAGVVIAQSGDVAAATNQGAQAVNDSSGGILSLAVSAVSSISLGAVATVTAIATQLGSIAVVAVLSGLLCFYFLRDGALLWNRLLAPVPEAHVDAVRATGRRAFEVMGGYMYGTAAISFVGAASQLVIMLILGVPLAIPVFVLSFFLCFIPYIGGFISTGMALMLTIGTGSEVAIVVMVIWTLVFNIVTGNIVSPIVYGKTVSLHPAIVLIAIPIGSAVAGLLGMLLVVPILGVIAVSWRTVLHVMANEPDDAGPAPETAEPDGDAGEVAPGPLAIDAATAG